MVTDTKFNPYVALIGAYERDNFGDILFLKVSEKLLDPWPVVPLSLLSRNMHLEGAGTVISASAWFDCCQDDFQPSALIVAGGEVLICPVSDALSCDVDLARGASFHLADAANKTRIQKAISWRSGDLAYVPDLKKFVDPDKQPIPFALNSIGGNNFESGSPIFNAALEAIELANYVSIRDSVTHSLFNVSKHERVTIDLNPDIVSTLPICCQPEVEAAYINAVSMAPWLNKPYLLVQMNDEYIRKNGLEIVGQAIAQTASALNLPVVFQPAGIAAGHDSSKTLAEVGRIMQAASGGRLQIFNQLNRDVWTQVAVIAHTACFVGTSLHGRIVASAYGRPRVGLKNSKVTNYATTWDEHNLQPFDVPIEDLLSAVKQAITTPPTELLSHANKQAELAATGFIRLRESLNLRDYTADATCTRERVRYYTELTLLCECEALREAVLDLGCELAQEQLTIQRIENKLHEILKAPSWRLAKPLRALDLLFPKSNTTQRKP